MIICKQHEKDENQFDHIDNNMTEKQTRHYTAIILSSTIGRILSSTKSFTLFNSTKETMLCGTR